MLLYKKKCENLQESINTFQENEKTLLQENEKLLQENQQTRSKLFNYRNVAADKKLFKSITSLEPDDFLAIFQFLNTGLHGENIKYYDKNKKQPKHYPQDQKPGMKSKLKAIDQFFLYLSWLKNGFTITVISWLFDLPKSTVSRYLITWSNLLYFSLGEINIWPSKEQVVETMPKTFKELYPSTRCIIDCTEIFCQRPSSLATQSKLYSSYKHHVTYKGLLTYKAWYSPLWSYYIHWRTF